MSSKKLMILIITFVIVVSGTTLLAGNFLDDAMSPSPLKNKGHNTPAYELQNSYNKIYNLYKDSVVFISTEKTINMKYGHPFMEDPFFREFFGPEPNMPKSQKYRGLGTGFIISKDGYICTNHHVVTEKDSITVKVAHKTYSARLIGSDPMTDIALLKIDGGNSFVPVHFGDSSKVNIGDIVIAIGNPFGLDKTITSGIISATGRRIVDDMGNTHLQTDASINPGNSGGPLINLDGEVIGVNRMIYSQTGGNLGISFAIPVNTARQTLIDLKTYGKVKRGFIGVQLSPLTPELAKELGLKTPEGALVGSIVENGPAAKAGIMVKDVILKIGSKKIKDYRDLIKFVGNSKTGETLQVTVWRNNKETTFSITVQERP